MTAFFIYQLLLICYCFLSLSNHGPPKDPWSTVKVIARSSVLLHGATKLAVDAATAAFGLV